MMMKNYKKFIAFLSVLIPLWMISTTDAQILKTFQSYEDLRLNSSNVTRVQNIDVAQNDDGTSTPFCHFAMVMPYSKMDPIRTVYDNGVLQGQATMMLAIEHLNTGNGTLVKDVEGLDKRCPIKFTAEVFDSTYSQTQAVDHVINLISREPGKEQLPCAFLGARWSSVSVPTSTVTGLKGYPQLSAISTSSRLDDKGQFPLFGRTIPSDAATAVPAILYLRYQLGVKHLVIVHVNDAYGDAYALGLQLAAAKHAPDMKLESFSFDFDMTPEIAERTIQLAKSTNYRYFFGIYFSSVHYEPFMKEAYKQGIAGTGEHFWMFSDSVNPSFFEGRDFETNSPLHLASIGATRISAVAGVPGNENYDKFFQATRDLNNPQDINLIQSKHPKYEDPDYETLQITDNVDGFFDGFAQSTLVPFLYDAAIALGLSACGARTDDSYFDGRTHYDVLKQTSFGGATGNNTFDAQTGSRLASSASFTLINIVEENTVPGDTVKLRTVVTDIFQEGKWQEIESLIFNDGSMTPPADLPPVQVDQNFIGWPLRGVGLAMSSLLMLVSIGLFGWTRYNRTSKVVKASQPMFLYMICAGCFLMGTSIIFLSIDDEIASKDVCSAFCITVPWFFCVGWILAFSALFAKTYRVNKIFHNPVAFSRLKVTVWDVIKPVVALFSVAFIVLILWTVLDPPYFTRVVSGLDPYERTLETKGSCTYVGSIPYASTLGVVLLGTLAYTVTQAYHARNISTEFAETEYIFLVLVAIFIVSLLGIPILFLVENNPSARFFTMASVIFLIDLSILSMIFVPKIRQRRRDAKERKTKEMERNKTNRQSVSFGSHRITITGLDFAVSDSGEISEDASDEDETDEFGARILHHPNKVEDLELQVSQLKVEIDTLRKKKKRTKTHLAVHNEDPQEEKEVEPVLPKGSSKLNSVNMAGEINEL